MQRLQAPGKPMQQVALLGQSTGDIPHREATIPQALKPPVWSTAVPQAKVASVTPIHSTAKCPRFTKSTCAGFCFTPMISSRASFTSKPGEAWRPATASPWNCGAVQETSTIHLSPFRGTSVKEIQAQHQVSGPTFPGTHKRHGNKSLIWPIPMSSSVGTPMLSASSLHRTAALPVKGSTSTTSFTSV